MPQNLQRQKAQKLCEKIWTMQEKIAKQNQEQIQRHQSIQRPDLQPPTSHPTNHQTILSRLHDRPNHPWCRQTITKSQRLPQKTSRKGARKIHELPAAPSPTTPRPSTAQSDVQHQNKHHQRTCDWTEQAHQLKRALYLYQQICAQYTHQPQLHHQDLQRQTPTQPPTRRASL